MPPARLGAPPRSPQRRVVVTGVGLVTPLGVGAAHIFARLLAGDGAVGPLAGPRFAPLPARLAAVVPRGPGAHEFDAAAHVPAAQRSAAGPDFIAFALAAAGEALAHARLPLQPQGAAAATNSSGYARARVGVSLGSGVGGLADTAAAAEAMAADAAAGHRRLSPFLVPRLLTNMAAGHVGIRWGLLGPALSPSSACATGAHAVGDAFRLIKHGHADAMLAGGAEACVHPLALAGFARARALSTARNDAPGLASRPFDAARDGFVLGEGAGVLVLEERRSARARGARILAELRGYGACGDAHHVTSPAEDGGGAIRCMAAALAEGGLRHEQVAYVNAHATSTPTGDAIEARAIDAVLGGAVDAAGAAALTAAASASAAGSAAAVVAVSSGAGGGAAGAALLAPSAGSAEDAAGAALPLVSSTKGAIGHLLGAAGAVEAIFTVLALQHGLAPPNVNLSAPDYAPRNYAFATLAPGAAQLAAGRPAALTNSFGFGGTYCSLAFAVDDGEDDELEA